MNAIRLSLRELGNKVAAYRTVNAAGRIGGVSRMSIPAPWTSNSSMGVLYKMAHMARRLCDVSRSAERCAPERA